MARKNKQLTNTELIKRIMTSYGPLGQAFVIDGLTKYVEQVSKLKPEDFGENSFVNPEAWIQIAKNIKNDLDQNYGRN